MSNVDNNDFVENQEINNEELSEFNDDYNVVYENEEEKKTIKYYLEKYKKVLFIILIIILIIIILLLTRSCSKNTKDTLNVDIPDIIYIGDENTFKTSVKSKNTSDNIKYNFTLSDEKLAILDYPTLEGKEVNNRINALASGEIKLTTNASINGKTLEDNKNILICKKLNEDSIMLDKITLEKGQQFALKANIDLGVSKCYNNITYTSDNDNLSIEDGIAKANKIGDSIIKVTDKETGKEYAFTINIIEKTNEITDLKLSETNIELKVGESKTITATTTPTNTTIVWTSKDTSVATVKNGKITGINIGKTTITATTIDEKISKTITVTVVDNGKSKVVKPTSSLCKTSLTYNGKKQELTTTSSTNMYELSNNTQINAGTYTITAKLKNGYVWKDNTTKDVTFKCQIEKATPTLNVKIEGTNKVDNTLTATVISTSSGTKTYKWWYKTSENGTKTEINNNTSSLKLTNAYLGKIIGVTVSVVETTNYKSISTSDTTDKTNNTSDKVLDKTGTDTYNIPSKPTIKASDNIESGKWHTTNVTLNFSGSTITNGSGKVVYYYGTDKDKLTTSGTTTGEISKQGATTYYVKACNSEDITKCSDTVSYELKIDTTAPVITYVWSSSTRVKFYCTDEESGIDWIWGEWKKSTSSSWRTDWNIDCPNSTYCPSSKNNAYIYFDIISSGTHNLYVSCKNNAGIKNYRYKDFVAGSNSNTNSSTITGTCTCYSKTDQEEYNFSCSSNGLKTETACANYCTNNNSYYRSSTCSYN